MTKIKILAFVLLCLCSCSGGGQSSITLTGSTEPTYSWKYKDWETCTNDKTTRIVFCERSDKKQVDDALCTGIKPAESQYCGAYSWQYTEFGDCINDNKTKTVFCGKSDKQQVEDSLCTGIKPIAESQYCGAYSWQSTDFGDCINDNKTKTVFCGRSDKQQVEDSLCTGIKPTAESQYCGAYSWQYPNDWGICINWEQTRTASCVRSDGTEVDNSLCSGEAIIKRNCLTHSNTINIEFVLVEAGTFKMGSDTNNDDEKPIHTVNITKNFYIGKYEVTQKQWKELMESNPSNFSDCGENCPVEKVSWDDAQSFIIKLNEKEGTIKYRLPTEAEWEFVAKGGKKSVGYTSYNYYIYSGSNNVEEVAWYLSNAENKTHPVGTLKANELGIYDMSGNVSEWVEDYYNVYSSQDVSDPVISSSTDTTTFRVIRGSSWDKAKEDVRATYRTKTYPNLQYKSMGFRVVRAF